MLNVLPLIDFIKVVNLLGFKSFPPRIFHTFYDNLM